MNEIWRESATTVAGLIRDKKISAREVTTQALQRIDGINVRINAIIDQVGFATPSPHMTARPEVDDLPPLREAVGLQIVVGRFREDLCLEAAQAIEQRGYKPGVVPD